MVCPAGETCYKIGSGKHVDKLKHHILRDHMYDYLKERFPERVASEIEDLASKIATMARKSAKNMIEEGAHDIKKIPCSLLGKEGCNASFLTHTRSHAKKRGQNLRETVFRHMIRFHSLYFLKQIAPHLFGEKSGELPHKRPRLLGAVPLDDNVLSPVAFTAMIDETSDRSSVLPSDPSHDALTATDFSPYL
jgi:hypothetical protein